MAKIRIISTPPGQAPEEIRNMWVGLVLPVNKTGLQGTQIGVLGGPPQNLGGYVVPTAAALAILGQRSTRAATWFRQHLPNTSLNLVFARGVCKLVED